MLIIYENLKIRSAELADRELLCKWWNDGRVMEHAGFPNGLGLIVEEIKIGKGLFIIEVDNVPVGEMSCRKIDEVTAEIGIKICDFAKQGKGYGSTFLKMLVNHLFTERGAQKVVLDTNLNNTRAQATYEKIGFTKVRVNHDAWKNQLGEMQSSVDYEILRENFAWEY